MKKLVPNIIEIEVPYDAEFFGKLHIKNIDHQFEQGYSISHRDFDKYCGVLLYYNDISSFPEHFQKYYFEKDKLKDRIRFYKVEFARQLKGSLNLEDELFYSNYWKTKITQRKNIVRNEIKKTGIEDSKINHNSEYYRTLIKIVREMDDEITLMPWFIPIKLSFTVFVHIYVKHVEETKFADGSFKKRTYFKYDYDQIMTLLKSILKQEEDSIKDHFLEVSANNILSPDQTKDYHRGFKAFQDIVFNDDLFALTIDKNGFIKKFHQKN